MPDAGTSELVIYLKLTTKPTGGKKMRCVYRETRYECGDYLEVNIYPTYRKNISRKRKSKPTSETQQKLNEIYSRNHLIRLANANFTDHDLKIELTYTAEHNPEDDETAVRELRNFLRRVKRYRERNNLSELKYIAVTERGSLKGRYHHHLIMSDMPLFDLVKLWGKGIVGSDILIWDENGIANLVEYMLKQNKRYMRSRNLIDPPAKKRDGRFSQRRVKELARDTDDRQEFEKLYEGYFLSKAEVIHNDDNGGVYIYARYYKKEAAWCRQKRSSRQRSSDGRSSQKRSTPSSG